MLKSHIFIYPSSYSEGLPTVFLEAAALGLAILTTDKMPGLAPFKERQAISAVPLSAMQTNLVKTVLDLDGLNKMRLESRKVVLKNFDWGIEILPFVRDLENLK